MKLAVRLFARARDLAGTDIVQLDVSETINVAELRRVLTAQCPALSAIAPSLLVAIGSQYADDSMPVEPADEVACFPPVSGG
jgi:molybdopterin converting factor subunit 1